MNHSDRLIEISQECRQHLTRCQRLMAERGIDLCLVATPVNCYYLLGRILNGYVALLPDGEPWIFVRRPTGLSGSRVVYIRKPEEMAERLATEGVSPRRVALETDVLGHNECVRLLSCFPDAALDNADTLLRTARAVKTAGEIAALRACGKVYAEAFRRVPELYRRGMSDHGFSLAFEGLLRAMGHVGIFRTFGVKMESFMGTSILVGDNADTPSPYDFALGGAGMTPFLPMGADGTVLRDGETMMVDGGGCFGAYITDMSRTFSLGKLPALALKAHECSREIHHRFAQTARPGVACADMYNDALEIVRRAGLADYFMGHRQQAAFVGHGVGLQINELPVLFARSRDVLADGMVIAVEPKFVIPGVGAVGVEDTYVIHADDAECITDGAPREIISLD